MPDQPPLPHHASLTLPRSKSYNWGTSVEKLVLYVPLPPRSSPCDHLKKMLVMTLPRQPMTRRVRTAMELTIQNRPRLKWYFLPLPWSSKSSRYHPEIERRTFSTVKTASVMRLSLFPDRWSTDLWPENSLESLKRSWWLLSLWAAMLLAATHVTSLVTSTVVW